MKCELAKEGYSLSDIASERGVSPHAVSKVKDHPSAPLQSAIAEKLGEAPEAIWPNRYQTRRAA